MFFKAQHIHFIGIGGIGMSGIAEILLSLAAAARQKPAPGLVEYRISGSDLRRSPVTARLERLGATVMEGHRAENVQGADIVVTGSGRAPESFPDEERERGWRDIESVADEVRSLGRRALPLVTDMTKAADAERLAAMTVSELGRVDILVNNAAAGRGTDRVPVIQLEESEWRRVIDLNLTGTFLVTKAVGAKMVAQGEGGRGQDAASRLG